MKDYRSLEHKIRDVHQAVLEAAFERNTKIRQKLSNVGRPDDGGEKLAKQGEIKIKVVDEAAVSDLSTKDSAKEETPSKKKSEDKKAVEPGVITGGKTEVELNPVTDNRDDRGKTETDKSKQATREANKMAGVKEETMLKSDKTFGLPADLIATVNETLKGNQKKLDKNHNGKLDKQDFEILRGKKKMEEDKSCVCEGKGPCQCVKEEVEEIEELSKDTLTSYALKAHRRGDMAARMSKNARTGDYDKGMAHYANKRFDGVQTAIKKIAAKEEVEEIDELSKKTLGSYIGKAASSLSASSYRLGGRYTDKEAGISAKRMSGIGRAAKKLTKEDVEFSESELAHLEKFSKESE